MLYVPTMTSTTTVQTYEVVNRDNIYSHSPALVRYTLCIIRKKDNKKIQSANMKLLGVIGPVFTTAPP